MSRVYQLAHERDTRMCVNLVLCSGSLGYDCLFCETVLLWSFYCLLYQHNANECGDVMSLPSDGCSCTHFHDVYIMRFRARYYLHKLCARLFFSGKRIMCVCMYRNQFILGRVHICCGPSGESADHLVKGPK